MTKNGSTKVGEVGNRAEALALIEADRRERALQAMQEIEAALAKHNCRLEAVVMIRGNQFGSHVEIQPND